MQAASRRASFVCLPISVTPGYKLPDYIPGAELLMDRMACCTSEARFTNFIDCQPPAVKVRLPKASHGTAT